MLTTRTRAAVAVPTIATALLLDQLTKWWALRALGDGASVPLVPTVELDLVYNSGFSFSAGAGYGQLIGLVVVVVCCTLAWLVLRAQSVVRLALLSAILGGALGNLADRAVRGEGGALTGEVVDFIDVSWYAVFNIADTLVVLGSIALVTSEMMTSRRATASDAGARSPASSGSPAGDAATG